MVRSFLKILQTSFRGLRISPDQRGLVARSISIGVVVWAVVFVLKEAVHWLFHEVLHWIEHAPHPVVLFIPLVIGALIVGVISYYRSNMIHYREESGEVLELNDVEGDGIERTIALYYSADTSVSYGMVTGEEGMEARWQEPTFMLSLRKSLATLATLGSGGSGGLEGSSVLVGESLAAGLYKLRTLLRRSSEGSLGHRLSQSWDVSNPDHLQVAQLSGVSAAVSVLLGTPLAAAFFASEIMYRRRPLLEKLFYALVSAFVARVLSSFVTGARPLLFRPEYLPSPPITLKYFLFLFFLGIGIAFIGQTYRLLSLQSDDWFKRRFRNRFARLTTGALITGAIALIVYWIASALGFSEHSLELVLGSGEAVIAGALEGGLPLTIALIALFAKMLATVATIGSGGSAGLLIPSLFFGTMVASILADLGDLSAATLIVPAMTGSLIALVNVPLAAIFFTLELFGGNYMVPVLLILIITGLLSNPKTLYRTQQEAPQSQEHA